jgi:hypothetical protein
MADPTALFSVAELQAFSAKVQDATKFSADDIGAVEAFVRRRFETACQVAFIPTTATDERHDGSGTDRIILNHRRPSAPTAVSVNGIAFSVTELADLWAKPNGLLIRREMGAWYSGSGNVLVTYEHGFSAVPDDIHREAMIYAVDQLVATRISDRTRSFSDDSGTYAYSWAGKAPHWTGIDSVDAVLVDYARKATVA